MVINETTKISTLIKHNVASVEAIAQINSHFEKHRNPVFRKLFASRVTIRDAAKIGKTEVLAFLTALEAIGFEIETKGETTIEYSTMENRLVEDKIKLGMVMTLDVRPILNRGNDPFTEIMQTISVLEEGYVLELINTFEPIPLLRILKQKGYLYSVKKTDSIVKTYILKGLVEKEQKKIQLGSVKKVSLSDLEEQRYNFKPPFRELDVRSLEMPMPMVTILRELEDLPEGEALFVHHKKVPQFLLPELEAKGMSVLISELGQDNVKLLIHR